LGLALLFGIRLPINFLSPYRARSIIEFWRRWHITLSHYLRDYLYIPLGGNRRGRVRQYCALLVTMALGGLWHGAGWTFVLWGLGHGALLLVNHAWRNAPGVFGFRQPTIPGVVAWFLTFWAVTLLWVLFRAPDIVVAGQYLAAMFDPSNIVLPRSTASSLGFFAHVIEQWGWRFDPNDQRLYSSGQLLFLVGCLASVLLLPNLYQFMERYTIAVQVRGATVLSSWIRWRPTWVWSLCFAIAFVFAVMQTLVGTSEFLYFRF